MTFEDNLTQLKSNIVKLPNRSGIYKMINAQEVIIYIGKAINLKNRVNSYFINNSLPTRLRKMMSEVKKIEYIVTNSDVDALLLEANLIKEKQPKYNIKLKDDKFFNYIILSSGLYPRIYKTRNINSIRDSNFKIFGPFVSSSYVDSFIKTIQKIFQIRNCTDSYFKSRTRPCLQYHIKQCNGPCMSLIKLNEYQDSIKCAELFLQGKNVDVKKILIERMSRASQNQNYEVAAKIRDSIKAIAYNQVKQAVNTEKIKEADFFSFTKLEEKICIHGVFYKDYKHYASHNFIFNNSISKTDIEFFGGFLMQFYSDKVVPKQIFINLEIDNKMLENALSKQHSKAISIIVPKVGNNRKIINNALKNAKIYLENDLSDHEILQHIAKILGVKRINRIEAFDNSHFQGSNAVGVMIAADKNGFNKKLYKKYLIKADNVKHNDDYAMMHEVLSRRIKYGDLPDLFLIDGGKGQLSSVLKVLSKYKVQTPVLAIAKGKDRFSGNETFFTQENNDGFKIADKKILYYLQKIRDESHRVAIAFHRSRRSKGQFKSLLDGILGIGKVRKKKILEYFGSVIALKAASIYDIQKVDGINKKLSQNIYNFIHEK